MKSWKNGAKKLLIIQNWTFFSSTAWLPKRPIFGRNMNLIGSPCLLSTISLVVEIKYVQKTRLIKVFMNSKHISPRPKINLHHQVYLPNVFLPDVWTRVIQFCASYLNRKYTLIISNKTIQPFVNFKSIGIKKMFVCRAKNLSPYCVLCLAPFTLQKDCWHYFGSASNFEVQS